MTSLGNGISGNTAIVAELREMYFRLVLWAVPSFCQCLFLLLHLPTLFVYWLWQLQTYGDRWSIQYSLQPNFRGFFLRSFWTLYLLSGQLSEGRKLFYQKYVKSYGYDKMKYSWPWSFIFVSRDLINGRRKFEPNKQVFYRSHQEFIWEKYLGSAVRNCYVCCDLTTTWY